MLIICAQDNERRLFKILFVRQCHFDMTSDDTVESTFHVPLILTSRTRDVVVYMSVGQFSLSIRWKSWRKHSVRRIIQTFTSARCFHSRPICLKIAFRSSSIFSLTAAKRYFSMLNFLNKTFTGFQVFTYHTVPQKRLHFFGIIQSIVKNNN